MRIVFTFGVLTCLAFKVIATVVIARYFQRRGIEVNRWLVRFLICAVAHRYRRATLEETGHVAPLYYALVLSTVLLIAFVVGALIVST